MEKIKKTAEDDGKFIGMIIGHILYGVCAMIKNWGTIIPVINHLWEDAEMGISDIISPAVLKGATSVLILIILFRIGFGLFCGCIERYRRIGQASFEAGGLTDAPHSNSRE